MSSNLGSEKTQSLGFSIILFGVRESWVYIFYSAIPDFSFYPWPFAVGNYSVNLLKTARPSCVQDVFLIFMQRIKQSGSTTITEHITAR
jgi:hypothetical protein